ncbi:MAG: tRNA (guanosine(46)-N7)-methyltransferase TrmB [Planctomycetaceae bacterium]
MPDPPQDLKPWFRVLEDLPEKVVWSEFFGNDNPVELDIGCGRGLFTFTASEANLDTNYLGLEIDYREGRRAARRLQKRDRQNARIVGGDCRVLLSKMIDPNSVAAAHVYFPDPWWKKKHMRRRLFTDEFVDLLYRIVKPNGLVHSWTDVEDYFEVISGLMNHDTRFANLPEPAERDPEHDMDYHTSFERKKRKLGMPIYRGMWRRDASPVVE